jgi:outer membrane lipoprotein-sorting protein
MNRRTLLLAAALLPTAAFAAPLTAADQADVARVEAYLNGLKTLKSRFLQVAPDGSLSEGDAWIDRPGKLRFEYDPPSPYLLIAGYGVGFFHDKQLGQTSHFQVSLSPLGILLAENVKLSGDVTVTDIIRQPGQLQLTLARTSSPNEGSITLVLADNPLSLRQWSIIDAQRKETRVSLFNITLGGSFDRKLFEFSDPRLLKPQNQQGSGG